ncbi:MAG: fimbrillin family protein, partial [Tannerella sp.]|nr:fimbrillin family protein [Tannerella sp.]
MEQKYQKNQAIGTGFESVRRCRAGLAVIADLIRNRPFNSCLWRRAVSLCALFLLTGAFVRLISSCETEYIPDTTENGHTTLIAKEGNFNLDLRFAGFGEGDMTPDPRSMEASKIDMKPETDIIRVDDDLYIYATLSVDPVDQAPPVRTRLFNTDARIRIIVYDSTATDIFTKKLETLYRDSMGTLVREDLVGYKINLDAGDYKFIAYSYNTTTPPPTWADTLTNIDSSNDLIWGMSPTVSIVQNATAPIPVPISMFHKMSQVKLVAKTGPSGPNITAFSGVSMPGYAVNMATFSGTISKTSDTPVPLTFNFPTVGSDSITSDTRTVYTAGNIPTIITIGTLTVDGRPSLTNVPATFAKSLQSGYSYTMRMQIGDSPALTDDEPPKGFVPYIGAFWKHDQVGERLIRMPRILNDSADGVWTAHVIEGKSWILLDTLAS